MHSDVYALGLDFGTDSVRCLLYNLSQRKTCAQASASYKRWSQGLYCVKSIQQYRQHPLDYLEAMEKVVAHALVQVDDAIRKSVISIGVGTTGSTPIAVNDKGQPLCFEPGFEEDADLLFWLWKDHTSKEEAQWINSCAAQQPTDYLQSVGGSYSSEWMWAKATRLLRTRPELAEKMYSFVEQSDWIPFMLTGTAHASLIKRNVCAAGHKGLWQEASNALPPATFFESVHPHLSTYAATFGSFVTAAQSVGTLSAEWAAKFGLHTSVIVSAGAIDAHVGAVGAGVKEGVLCKVMGTSTCDMMIAQKQVLKQPVHGINGQVMGSILPGVYGLEAGQAAFGDAYAWMAGLMSFSQSIISGQTIDTAGVLTLLEEQAVGLAYSVDDPIAVDWFNGRRSPVLNNKATGAFAQLSLATTAPMLYRALVEATCFGSKAILDAFETAGVAVQRVVALGGIAQKSSLVMQTMANVLERPIEVSANAQACALGSVLLGATAAGYYSTAEQAIADCVPPNDKTFYPSHQAVQVMAKRYQRYQSLGMHLENF